MESGGRYGFVITGGVPDIWDDLFCMMEMEIKILI